ncbi:uncharacterized protein Dana_GF22445 [Drosophila ananassae]|uniref:Uncharacterized protein n=1 Tax=Drosophila ananassae TaxID=7217 RepID=B3MWH6_DROAN|nr:uncharacterized protein LOC6505106 [Drosophila ananassae]EDV34961.1 uncharacterized protein Dana_GF22445 [Drosophila ananassae]
MPSIKSCLKVLFQGETSFIICENANTYEEVISQAMNRFGISEQEREALILTNGKGYVFEAHLLEYFLLLFPCPEITFHLRYDFQLLRRSLSQESKSSKRKRSSDPEEEEHEDQDQDYEPVPVYRQNCFLGSLPPSDSNRGASVHRQSSFLREQQQLQMSRLEEEQDLREELEDLQPRTASQAKRLRLEACHKPRRTASSNPPPPLMRSIRI